MHLQWSADGRRSSTGYNPGPGHSVATPAIWPTASRKQQGLQLGIPSRVGAGGQMNGTQQRWATPTPETPTATAGSNALTLSSTHYICIDAVRLHCEYAS
eukprot:6631600-Prymnesium_polylepis.2